MSGDTDQTRRSFHDKWHHNRDAAFRETLRAGSDIQAWILGRNGFADRDAFAAYLSRFARILDAGCGNGRVTALLRELSRPQTEIVGADLVASRIAEANLAGAANVSFRDADLLGDLAALGSFDFIYCQEVLHHTSDPQGAFTNLCSLLAPGGEIAIYVYRRKAPAREFVDDFVRARMAGLEYTEASAMARQITDFGRALAESGAKVTVPAVPVLDIKAGEYDVQRLVYHFFMKCFWNPDLSLDDNVAINYDWYHPQLCSRHTIDEVRGWFEAAGLSVIHALEDHYGITMRGRRKGG